MRRSRLSRSIQQRLIEHFVSGSTARTAASLVGVNKSTAAFYFHRLREIIALGSEDASPLSARSKSTRATSEAIARQAWSRGWRQDSRVWLAKTRRQGLCQNHRGRQGQDTEGHHRGQG